MKKSLVVMALFAMFVCPELKAVEFAYDAGAEIVSAYIWRGQYNGGLSFQPDAEFGFNALDEVIQFRAGVWASIGASDWKFQKGLPETEDGNPNTYFVPELDVLINFTLGGLTFGVTHYYYFGGSPFFNWKKFDPINGSAGTSQTELSLSYDFGKKVEILPLTISWNTMVGGDDLIESDKVAENADGTPMLDEEGNEIYELKRAFSSYVEVRWDQPLPFGLTVSAALGVSPWASPVYGNKKIALTNLMAKVNKEWEFDACTIDLYALGSINTDHINKSNAYISAAGDNKLYLQKLNGCIGLGIWF